MLKTIMMLLTSKGTLIGFTAGFLKIMLDIKEKRFNWLNSIIDIAGSSIMGYTVYTWSSESEVLSWWQIYLLTVYMSINAFVVIKIIQDPVIFKMLFNKWFKNE